MGDKTMVSDSTVNNYGMTIRGTIEGTALSFREEFKRVSPKVTGFYVFESEVSLRHMLLFLISFGTERIGCCNEDDLAGLGLGRF